MAENQVRAYTVNAHSTATFGRVLCNTRNHHFVVDGPVQNGCPGEALTPSEIFLAGIAACGVELVQVLAKDQRVPLRDVDVEISGTIDRSKPVRPDLTLFNRVQLNFHLGGVTSAQGADLIERFKGK